MFAEQYKSLKALCREMEPVGPSYREIQAVWGLKSLQCTKNRLDRMRSLGMVDWLEGRARSLHIVTHAVVLEPKGARLHPLRKRGAV